MSISWDNFRSFKEWRLHNVVRMGSIKEWLLYHSILPSTL